MKVAGLEMLRNRVAGEEQQDMWSIQLRLNVLYSVNHVTMFHVVDQQERMVFERYEIFAPCLQVAVEWTGDGPQVQWGQT